MHQTTEPGGNVRQAGLKVGREASGAVGQGTAWMDDCIGDELRRKMNDYLASVAKLLDEFNPPKRELAEQELQHIRRLQPRIVKEYVIFVTDVRRSRYAEQLEEFDVELRKREDTLRGLVLAENERSGLLVRLTQLHAKVAPLDYLVEKMELEILSSDLNQGNVEIKRDLEGRGFLADSSGTMSITPSFTTTRGIAGIIDSNKRNIYNVTRDFVSIGRGRARRLNWRLRLRYWRSLALRKAREFAVTVVIAGFGFGYVSEQAGWTILGVGGLVLLAGTLLDELYKNISKGLWIYDHKYALGREAFFVYKWFFFFLVIQKVLNYPFSAGLRDKDEDAEPLGEPGSDSGPEPNITTVAAVRDEKPR